MIDLIPVSNNFDDIYADMILQFPVEELKTKSYFIKLCRDKDYKIFRCYKENTEIGYIMGIFDEYIWVDYFAVHKNFQSNGYGSKILESLFKKFGNCSNGVLFEVEKIDSNNITTIRRQDFYKKIGCINTGLNYLFPSYNKIIPMDLLYFPLRERIINRQEILFFIRKVFNKIHADVKSKDIAYSKIT